jgi:hypothetical protein
VIVRRILAAGLVLVGVSLVGCGGQSVRADQQKEQVDISVSRSAASTQALAAASEIPKRTPRWLIRQAHVMAKALHDPHPRKLRISLGRRVDFIDMWGHFVCDLCSYPNGASPPRGTHARSRVIVETHRSTDFWLTRR